MIFKQWSIYNYYIYSISLPPDSDNAVAFSKRGATLPVQCGIVPKVCLHRLTLACLHTAKSLKRKRNGVYIEYAFDCFVAF